MVNEAAERGRDRNQDEYNFGFISFEKDEVEIVAEANGLNFNDNDYLVENNETVKCDCCGVAIKKNNLGSILPGSKIVYCTNTACFSKYVTEHLEED